MNIIKKFKSNLSNPEEITIKKEKKSIVKTIPISYEKIYANK